MSAIVPKTFDQFVKFAMTCNAIVWVKTQTNPVPLYTVAALPLDVVVQNVSQTNFDKMLLAFPDAQEVNSITQS